MKDKEVKDEERKHPNKEAEDVRSPENRNAFKTNKDSVNPSPEMEKDPYDIYDRLFKTCLTLSKTAVLHFINGLFDMDYPGSSTLAYNWTEFIDRQSLRKTLADTIITVNGTDAYHFEAQMKGENIILRVLEYGFRHGVRNIRQVASPDSEETCFEIRFPRQMIIYLDAAGGLPDEYPVRIVFQGKDIYEYRIPVLRFQEKTPEEIRSKHMVILIPFKLLSMRRSLEKEYSPKNINRLLDIYKNDILNLIDQSSRIGEITREDAFVIKSITMKLFRHLYRKYDEVWEVIQEMHDQSITLDCDPILEEYERVKAAYEEAQGQLSETVAQISEKKAQISEQEAQISEQEAQISKQEAQISEQEAQISEQNKLLSEKDEQLSAKEEMIARLQAEIAALKGTGN